MLNSSTKLPGENQFCCEIFNCCALAAALTAPAGRGATDVFSKWRPLNIIPLDGRCTPITPDLARVQRRKPLIRRRPIYATGSTSAIDSHPCNEVILQLRFNRTQRLEQHLKTPSQTQFTVSVFRDTPAITVNHGVKFRVLHWFLPAGTSRGNDHQQCCIYPLSIFVSICFVIRQSVQYLFVNKYPSTCIICCSDIYEQDIFKTTPSPSYVITHDHVCHTDEDENEDNAREVQYKNYNIKHDNIFCLPTDKPYQK